MSYKRNLLLHFISEVMPLEQWEEAFDKSSKGMGIKYLLKPLRE